MKTWKMRLLVLFSGIIVSLVNLTGTSFAAVQCLNTKIEAAGYYPSQADEATGNSGYRVQLTCLDDVSPDQLAFSGTRSFYLSADLGDAGYASLLTAYSLGTNIRVQLASSDFNSLVLSIYMQAQ